MKVDAALLSKIGTGGAPVSPSSSPSPTGSPCGVNVPRISQMGRAEHVPHHRPYGEAVAFPSSPPNLPRPLPITAEHGESPQERQSSLLAISIHSHV